MSKMIELPLVNGPVVSLKADRILCNDINLPYDPGYNHGSHLWVIASLYGPMGAVWAKNQEEAIDVLIDNDLGKAIEMDESEKDHETFAGHDNTPVDLTHVQLYKVKLSDYGKHVALFAEARGARAESLDDL